jgi:hypothetical protein
MEQIKELGNDISTIQDKMETNVTQLKNDMIKTSAHQDKAESDISAIRNGQTEFEEKITDTLQKRLRSIIIMVEKQAQNLCEEFNSELQATR